MTNLEENKQISEAIEEFFTLDIFLSEIDNPLSQQISLRKRSKKKKDKPPIFEGIFRNPLYGKFSSWTFNAEKNQLIIYADESTEGNAENTPELNQAIHKLFEFIPIKKSKLVEAIPKEGNRNMTRWIRFVNCFDESYMCD